MNVLARIKQVSTGEVRTYETDFLEGSTDYEIVFQWEENNYSCDCNRAMFFNNYAEPDRKYPCGETEYKVRVFSNGRLLYEEFTESEEWRKDGGK
jgi:hypothetical protein